jgi:hypothetical protein
VEVYSDTGTGGWYRPADSVTTTSWSFSTYKILNSSSDCYGFHLVGDLFGSEGDPAYFEALVLVKSEVAIPRFYDLEMTSSTEGTLTLGVTPADTALFFIVASMPESFSGAEQLFGYEIEIEKGVTSADEGCEYPGEVHLRGSFPSPFSSTATIEYETPSSGPARLSVHDLSGRLLATLVDEQLAAGNHHTLWNGRDESGQELPSGIYLLRLEASGQVVCGSVTLLR